MAYTQPGGAGASSFVYDDTLNTNHASAPAAHPLTELSGAFAADFSNLGTTARTSYRFAQNFQIGDGVASFNVTCTTNATNIVTSAALFAEVYAGMTITGSGIPASTTVTFKTSNSNITISNAATNSTTAARTFADPLTGTATTTVTDTNKTVIFDTAKTLSFRATQQTSWFLNLGTKVGSGNQASGVNGCDVTFGAATILRGTCKFYGCALRQTTGAFTWSPLASGSAGEAINCLFQSAVSAGTAPFVIGNSSSGVSNMYNVDFSHVTSNQVITNFFVDSAELITIACAAPTAFMNSGSSGLTVKDLRLFGSPTQSDLRWASAASVGWKLIRPKWTNNAPKFTTGSANSPNIGGATSEYWLYNTKVVDGRDGSPISGISIRLTDVLGNVQVNTTTDAMGEITFGSGLLSNAVAVMDHYISSGTTYAQQHRSPFLVEINTVNRNPNYPTFRYYKEWLGYDSVTTNAGTFADMTDVIAMLQAGGNPSSWIERNSTDVVP